MVIVDSSVLIDFLAARANRQTVWLNQQSDLQRIGITSLSLCEVLQGIRDDARFDKIRITLSRFTIFEIGSRDLAFASARNFRVLRKRGLTVRNTIDCLIATFCIEERHVLLHNDRDFDGFETHLGLRVLHPPEFVLH